MADKKRIVVLSGSGISAESGLSTFRGGNGLWDNVPVEEVCSAQAWRHHPEKVQEFFNVRRAQLRDVEPNDAHKILAQMEEDFDVDVVTQNVDNLHERAGSSKVLHLHGELTKVRPEDCCCERDGFSTEYVMDIGYRRDGGSWRTGENPAQTPHCLLRGGCAESGGCGCTCGSG